MSEDATLGDFLDSDGHTDVDGEPTGTDGSEVEPARTTYAFTPGGASCDGCGTTTDRRWHQDGSLVCADCKEW